METKIYIKSLGVTSIVTDKAPKHEAACQSNVKLTSKVKVNTVHKMANIESTMLREAQLFQSNKSSEARKNSKKAFFNKHKSNK